MSDKSFGETITKNNTDKLFHITESEGMIELGDIFINDAFTKGIRKTKYENDPRDGPMDGVRRKFPKIWTRKKKI